MLPFQPGLKDEYGWSYQVGLESGLADLVNLKGTLFRHETSRAISIESIPRQRYRTAYNRGDVTRQGYELEADTVPFYNLSLKLGQRLCPLQWRIPYWMVIPMRTLTPIPGW